jgi:hypothetical protein
MGEGGVYTFQRFIDMYQVKKMWGQLKFVSTVSRLSPEQSLRQQITVFIFDELVEMQERLVKSGKIERKEENSGYFFGGYVSIRPASWVLCRTLWRVLASFAAWT